MMDRSHVNPIIATLQLIVISIGVPFWGISRLSEPVLPFRPMDIIFLIALGCWVLVFRAIVSREEPVDSLAAGPGAPMWYAHRMVDNSLFGVGMVSRPELALAPLAATITMPRELQPSELPPDLPWAGYSADLANEDADPASHRAMPTLHVEEPEGPVIGATEEYIVGRGATWWSIAEATLGDGRDWHALQEVNIGREVAPGCTLAEGDDLRIGWSILVPIPVSENEGEPHDVE